MYKRIVFFLLTGGILLASNPAETNGKIPPQKYRISEEKVNIPQYFNPEKAQRELIEARKSGNKELCETLSKYLHEWWKRNRTMTPSTLTRGYNPEPGQKSLEENKGNNSNSNQRLLWGNDVQMDPRTGIYDVKITSLSNGELYAIAILEDSIKVILMSQDNGETWQVKYEYSFGSNMKLSSPGIMAINDTLVEWYIIHNLTDDTYWGWVKVGLPGPGDNAVFWGSPTGILNPYIIRSFHLATDAPVWGPTEYLYVTWVEYFYNPGDDSTRVMFARSNGLDVSTWEIGPVAVLKTLGDNIYYRKSRIAYGAPDKLWIVAPLHPSAYPIAYDETIAGVYSDDYGSTWQPSDPYNPIWITSFNDRKDDYEVTIAGSYTDSNWVILTTRTDTGSLSGYVNHIYNVYTTDAGNTWNETGWVTVDSINILPYVYVDNASTGFYGVFRKDIDNNGGEEVRLKIGDINNPTSWTYSGDNIINDNNSHNLSNYYGPAVSYNPSTGEPIVVWTDFEGLTYTIWFDAQLRVDVAETNPENNNRIRFLTFPQRKGLKISLSLPFSSKVNLNLYSSEGRRIKTIINSNLSKGTYSYSINNLKSGKYFLKLKTENIKQTKSVIIVK